MDVSEFQNTVKQSSTVRTDASCQEDVTGSRSIRGAMIDALRKLDWAPRSVHRKARAAAAAVRDIERETGRDAKDAEVAARMGCSLDEYYAIVQDAASCRLTSLDDLTIATATAADSVDPFQETADEGFRGALVQAIEGLPELIGGHDRSLLAPAAYSKRFVVELTRGAMAQIERARFG